MNPSRVIRLAFGSLSILVRSESDNPQALDVHSLDLYVVEANPAFERPQFEEEFHYRTIHIPTNTLHKGAINTMLSVARM